jgi:hypothetical protein
MKKQPLNEEFQRMQKLAGLINEAFINGKGELGDFNLKTSKKDKIAVIKEWIWYTCDEGQAKDDINEYNKMVDSYFADKNDVSRKDFKIIWSKVVEKYGVGDIGADWEAFEETWKDVQTGTLTGM